MAGLTEGLYGPDCGAAPPARLSLLGKWLAKPSSLGRFAANNPFISSVVITMIIIPIAGNVTPWRSLREMGLPVSTSRVVRQTMTVANMLLILDA